MNSIKKLQSLSATELKDKLTALTIGGANGVVDFDQKKIFFKEYMERAFPEMEVINLLPIQTSASLNSISATAEVKINGQKMQVFGKVHIESETKIINAVGVEEEYQKAILLVKAGWPVVKPITISKEKEYPLLLYPKMDQPTLFDELEKSNTTGVSTFNSQLIKDLKNYNQTIGQKELQSLKPSSINEAINAPVQTLFLKRFMLGGRIDQWYKDDTLFNLPGIVEQIPWKKLLSCSWEINGIIYKNTFKSIIDCARNVLLFKDETNAFLILNHGDDHAGNVRLTRPPLVFDPAFAGNNPVSLEIKALAHTGFLPLAAMYYFPKGLKVVYQIKNNLIKVSLNIDQLPMYSNHEELAKQIIDFRLIPLLKKIKTLGGDIEKETQRIKFGLSGCALLTINIAKLLQQGDGRAIGLLPMAIMFSELKGLSRLEYFNSQINKL